MHAIISDGRSVRLEPRHPAPKPAAGEAVVRLRAALLSPFDHATIKGQTGFVGVIGHQFVGEVETVHGDADASRRFVHQRVVGSIVSSCGACDLCLKGLSTHCRHRTLMGICGRDGCLAEQFVIPARQLTVVPKAVDDDHAVFAFEVASALHTAQQLTIANRPYITILGDGVQALISGQIMSKLNASVRVVGTDASRLDVCSKWNVKSRLLEDVGRRNDQDIVVDCTCDGSGISAALTLVRPRGKVVLKSLTHQAIAPELLNSITRHEIEVIGSFAGSMTQAIAAIAANQIDVITVIGRRVLAREDSLVAVKLTEAALVTMD